MGAFDQIYGATSERPFIRRYLISFALAIATGACFVLAAVCLGLAPFFAVRHPGVAWEVLAFLARWALGLGFLSLAVGLLVHTAPTTSQPLPWVSLGTMIVIVWWVIVSVGFYFYLTDLASYGSVFGSLASVIVVIAYLYISTTAFLFGAQLDAIIRAQFHRNTVRRGIGPFAPALGHTGVCLGRRSVVARVRVEHGARCSQSPGSLGPCATSRGRSPTGSSPADAALVRSP